MKPEKGSDDMDDEVWDPMDLFIDIGMLITEARTPELSVKGRVEGPHCPPIYGASQHLCDKHREQCRKADQGRKQMILLYRNNIPMRIDVLLLPNCNHGHIEASTMDGANLSNSENCILVERWDIQINSKRAEKNDGFVSGRILLQAVRSYLHFSQMSSWLTSSMGTLPLSIVYRLYAPGESVSHAFSLNPDAHTFPAADLSHVAVRVLVSSLPRQEMIPLVFCKEEESSVMGASKHTKIPVRKKVSPDKETDDFDKFKQNRGKTKLKDQDFSLSKFYKKEGKKELTENIPKTVCDTSDNLTPRSILDVIPKSTRHKPPSGRKQKLEPSTKEVFEKVHKDVFDVQDQGTSHERGGKETARIGFSKLTTADKIKQSVKDSFREKPLIFPPQEGVGYGIMGGMKRLPSPKVLFTCSNNRGPQSYYKKRQIDFGQPGEDSENLEEKVMTGKLKDLVQPLNSEEIEAYLSSLSSHQVSGKSGLETNLDDIPMTKCKFYIGEDESEKVQEYNLDMPEVISDEEKGHRSGVIPESMHVVEENKAKSDNVARNLFLKSFSEPGPNLENFKPRQFNEGQIGQSSQVSEGQGLNVAESQSSNIADCLRSKVELGAEISNGSSPEEGDLSDGSHDSTPTNSLSETNGVMTISTCLKDKHHLEDDLGISSREATPTLELESKYMNKKCDSLEKKFSSMTIINDTHSSLSSNQHAHSKNNCEINEASNVRESSHGDENSGNKVGFKGSSLCKKLLTKELHRNLQNEALTLPNIERKPDQDDILKFRQNLGRSASMMFSTATGLPTQSSPAPVKRKSTGRFDYDCSLTSARAIKNALSCSKLVLQSESRTDQNQDDSPRILSTSAPASTNCLLGNFEESVLNGRIEPVGVVEGFNAEIGAGGSFCPKHLKLPVTAYFFQLSDDNAPSPYLGHINLEPVGKKGYHIPKCGTLQITLFNPNNTVVKMFVVMYDLSDMPPNCQTFLRQRTVYMPVDPNSCEPSFLRYLIHLRFASSKSGKIHLHTDIRLIFARDKFEFDPKVANYELRSFTEGPQNPKFSPKR